MANEKRLISVDDCPCDGCKARPCGHPARCVKFTLWLNKTVDAVEVVRCKGCKHCFSDAHGLWCFRDYEINLKPDDFCSSGERKDGA